MRVPLHQLLACIMSCIPAYEAFVSGPVSISIASFLDELVVLHQSPIYPYLSISSNSHISS